VFLAAGDTNKASARNCFVRQISDRARSRDIPPSIALPPETLKHGIMPRDFYPTEKTVPKVSIRIKK